MILDGVLLCILNVYCRSEYVTPVARYRIVAANLTLAETASRMSVSCLVTSFSIKLKSSSNASGLIRKNFWYSISSSERSSCTKVSYTPSSSLRFNQGLAQVHLTFPFLVFRFLETTARIIEAAAILSTSLSMARKNQNLSVSYFYLN